MARQMDRTEWLLLLTLSIPWGGSFFFYKILAAALPPLTVALGRVAIAALALTLVLRVHTGRERSRRQIRQACGRYGSLLLMGLLNNAVPFTLFAWGEQRIDSGLAAIFNATTPIFAVLVLHVTTATERLTWNRAIGVMLGFAGVAMLVGPQKTGGASSIAGAVACLLAAFSYACAAAYGRRFRDLSPLVTATGQAVSATLLLLPASAWIEHPWTLPQPPVSAWASLFGLGLICTAFAYLLYFRILATAGAGNLMLVTFLVPVTALLLGHFVLNERMTVNAIAGMALIAAGLASIDGRVVRLLAENRKPAPALRSAGRAGEAKDDRSA